MFKETTKGVDAIRITDCGMTRLKLQGCTYKLSRIGQNVWAIRHWTLKFVLFQQ